MRWLKTLLHFHLSIFIFRLPVKAILHTYFFLTNIHWFYQHNLNDILLSNIQNLNINKNINWKEIIASEIPFSISCESVIYSYAYPTCYGAEPEFSGAANFPQRDENTAELPVNVNGCLATRRGAHSLFAWLTVWDSVHEKCVC